MTYSAKVRIPSGVSAFLIVFEKAENKKRRFYLRSSACQKLHEVVTLVLKSWNRIVEHLEKWRMFAIDLAASDLPQETEVECMQEEVTYEPIPSQDRYQGPQVSY